MEMTLEQMALQLLGLPASSRALLAKKLIESLDETEERDVEKLWVDLAEERLQGILRGERPTQGGEDVFREARINLE